MNVCMHVCSSVVTHLVALNELLLILLRAELLHGFVQLVDHQCAGRQSCGGRRRERMRQRTWMVYTHSTWQDTYAWRKTVTHLDEEMGRRQTCQIRSGCGKTKLYFLHTHTFSLSVYKLSQDGADGSLALLVQLLKSASVCCQDLVTHSD